MFLEHLLHFLECRLLLLTVSFISLFVYYFVNLISYCQLLRHHCCHDREIVVLRPCLNVQKLLCVLQVSSTFIWYTFIYRLRVAL